MPDRLTQERIAKNDATFRDANEKISAIAEENDLTEQRVPFICECADLSCTEIVTLRLEEYWEVRSNPTWFFNAPGHEVALQGSGAVLARRDGYVVVEKQGHAGEVAADLAQAPSER